MGASIFFFADIAAMSSQNATPGDDDAFGPVQGSETTKFRVTSLHKGSAALAAYAVCDGRVRVQKDDQGLLTIVLAPDVEVLRGVPIRFFVYRGIREDSLIQSNILKKGTALADKLLNDDPPQTAPDALGLAFRRAKAPEEPAAGFEREDSDAIDTLFFETTDLKPIPVKTGDTLGLFESTGFGFEIMVRSIWPAPTLEQLRKVSVTPSTGNIIDVSSQSNGNLARAQRERVYEYLDPCAFYGMCFDRGVQYKAGTTASASVVSTQELYDQLLSKFQNRNTVYLDLRNDNGLSYNYYDTHGNGEILLGLKTATLKKRKPKVDPAPEGPAEAYSTDGWPLKIIKGAKFNVPDDAKNAGLRLAMDTGGLGNSIQRHVFLEFARLYYDSSARRSELPADPGRSGRLLTVSHAPWTSEVVLGLPTAVRDANTPTPKTQPLAFAVRLRYLRQNEAQPTTTGRYISTASQWDNLFVLDLERSRWKNDHSSNWWLTGHLKYVEPQLDNQQIYKGMAEAGLAVDLDPVNAGTGRYTFYFVPVHVVPEPSDYRVTRGTNPAGTAGSGTRTSFFQRVESGTLYDGSCYLTLLKQSEFNRWSSAPVDKHASEPPLPDPAAFLTYLTFLESVRPDDQKDTGSNPFHTKESLCAISFSADEYDSLLNHAAAFDRTLHPVFLQVRRRVFPRNDDTATHRAYQAIELRIVGYDNNGQYHSFDVPSTGSNKILPLSLPADGMIFCTNNAADFEPLEVTQDVQICTQIRHESMRDPTRDKEHEEDVLYFSRAIADLKRYAPASYKELQDIQIQGVEVILHDTPGAKNKKLRRYRISVAFDDSMRIDRKHPQVTVTTHASNFPEDKVRTKVTEPILKALSIPPMPNVEFINAESMYRLSVVTITFSATSNGNDDLKEVNGRLTSIPLDSLVPECKLEPGPEPTGETSGSLYVGRFPGETIEQNSQSGFSIDKLQTLAGLDGTDRAKVVLADPFGYGDVLLQPTARRLNESRYIALNTERHLSSSQVNARFLADYTAQEIDTNVFRADRLYVQSIWTALRSGNPGDSGPHRITLEDLRLLGLGTYDPEKPVTIRLNRRDIKQHDENFIVAGKETGYHPRRRVVSITLGHELGHAKFMIQNPLVQAVWSTLERTFDYKLTSGGPLHIAELFGPAASELSSYRLLSAALYPTPLAPHVISKELEKEDGKRTDPGKTDRNQQLLASFFLTKTGGGHLRGSPTGASACSIEMEMDLKFIAEFIPMLVAQDVKTVSFDYCFLNLEGANLNP